jgi:hypothetical protein
MLSTLVLVLQAADALVRHDAADARHDRGRHHADDDHDNQQLDGRKATVRPAAIRVPLDHARPPLPGAKWSARPSCTVTFDGR